MHRRGHFPNVIFDASLRPKGAAFAIIVLLLFFLLVLLFVTFLAPPAQAQTFKVLYSFTGGEDGGWPQAGPTMDAAGNIYGTTFSGGDFGGDCTRYGFAGCGTVFMLSKQGVNWTFSSLYAFHGGVAVTGDGSGPSAPVTIGPDGTLYSSTEEGGKLNQGTVFSLRPPAFPSPGVFYSWKEDVLYVFDGIAGGYSPRFGPIALDPSGAMYVTTYLGGAYNIGAVVELTPAGSGWKESVIHSFSGRDGCYADTGVILDASGNLYGTTNSGGAYGNGVVFQLVRSETGWIENVLYEFRGTDDGRNPAGTLTFDESGSLYGTTSTMGGPGNGGTVFKLTRSNGDWTFTVLHDFVYGSEGQYPSGGVVFDQKGNLYGMTGAGGAYWAGTVYKLTPSDGGWTYTSLHEFTGGSDGAIPSGKPILDESGNLYGMTEVGGIVKPCPWAGGGCGVVFEITP